MSQDGYKENDAKPSPSVATTTASSAVLSKSVALSWEEGIDEGWEEDFEHQKYAGEYGEENITVEDSYFDATSYQPKKYLNSSRELHAIIMDGDSRDEEMEEEDFDLVYETSVAEAIAVEWDEPDDQPIIGDQSVVIEESEPISEVEAEFEYIEEEVVTESAKSYFTTISEPHVRPFQLQDYANKHKSLFQKFFQTIKRSICESDDMVTARFNINQLGGPATDMKPPIRDMYSALQGISRVRPRVVFYPEERVLIRMDDSRSQYQVKLISGGSTGKEPLFTEYVGRGMLAAAILGSTTVGPTVGAVLRTIKEVYNEKGALIVLRKSAEHRLIFGMALEQARSQGLEKVDMVMIGDDSFDRAMAPTGRKGLAGIVLALKLAGALCFLGRPLKFVADSVRAAAFDMATISAITHPEIIIGPVSKRIYEIGEKFTGTLRELVIEMLKYLLDPRRRYSLRIIPSRKYVVLVNSYQTNWPQLYRVSDYMMLELESKGLPVSKLYAASFVGGPCPGFSITVLSDQDDHYAHLLDAPTDCIVWHHSLSKGEPTVVKVAKPDVTIYYKRGICISKRKAMIMRLAIQEACRVLIESELLLNWIDVFNKYGSQMRCAVEAIHLSSQAKHLDYRHPYSCFLMIADILTNNLPHVLSCIQGCLFIGAAQAFISGAETVPWIGAVKRARKCLSAFTRGGLLDVMDRIVPLVLKCINKSITGDYQMVINNLSTTIEEIMKEVEARSANIDMYTGCTKSSSSDCDKYGFVIWVDAVLSVTIPGYKELRKHSPSIADASVSFDGKEDLEDKFDQKSSLIVEDNAAYV